MQTEMDKKVMAELIGSLNGGIVDEQAGEKFMQFFRTEVEKAKDTDVIRKDVVALAEDFITWFQRQEPYMDSDEAHRGGRYLNEILDTFDSWDPDYSEELSEFFGLDHTNPDEK